MFNITQIQSCFAGLVGFRQPNDPSYPEIIPELNEPITGRFVSHKLCTIENLFSAGPEFNGFSNVTTPAELKTVFNDWLTKIYNDSCTDLVSRLLQMKKINDAAKSLIENQQLYTGFGFVGDKVIKHSRFVGFQIDTKKKNNLMVILSKIGFQVDEAQTVKFYLYHTSQVDAIKDVDVVITKASSFTWKDTLNNLMLSYMDGDQSSEGFYIFGYYEDDLEGQAIKMDKTLQSAPCLSCSYADTNAFNAWNKYMGIRAIEVPQSALDPDKKIFDVSQMKYTNNTNWGINLSVTTICDLTQFFCSNRLSFVDALSQQIALNMINVIAYSTRINSISDKTKGLAMADLDVDSKSSFVNFEYQKALDALNVDFSGFDSDCLPCRRNSGIKYSAI